MVHVTRQELRATVEMIRRDAAMSWVATGLAFSQLAPHILAELDKAEAAERLAAGPHVE